MTQIKWHILDIKNPPEPEPYYELRFSSSEKLNIKEFEPLYISINKSSQLYLCVTACKEGYKPTPETSF